MYLLYSMRSNNLDNIGVTAIGQNDSEVLVERLLE